MLKVATFDTFEAFVTTHVPEGLGTDLRTLKNLCRDHAEALAAIDKETRREPDIHIDGVNNVNARPQGNSRDRALRRLRKDRPDLLQQVIAKELTAHSAMVKAVRLIRLDVPGLHTTNC